MLKHHIWYGSCWKACCQAFFQWAGIVTVATRALKFHFWHELVIVMDSSIRGIFIFGNWAGAWKTIMHDNTLQKNDNICLCLILVISHLLSGYSMPLCRHSIAVTICLRDRPCELLCGDGLFMLVFALRCMPCMLSKFQVLYGHQSFASTLASDNPPCWRGKNKVYQNHCFADVLIQPGVPNYNRNDNKTITKKSHNHT